MNEQIREKLREIKQSFRLLTNGVAPHSIRQKGITYKIDWGVPTPDLQKMAVEYSRDYELAIGLQREDIRECQVLAALIIPVEKVSEDLVEVWMERLRTQEMTELLVFNLLRYLDFTPALAYKRTVSECDIYQLCGYQLLAHLFARGMEPNEQGINEFLDQAHTTLAGESLPLGYAVYNYVLSFCKLRENFDTMAQKAFADLNILQYKVIVENYPFINKLK